MVIYSSTTTPDHWNGVRRLHRGSFAEATPALWKLELAQLRLHLGVGRVFMGSPTDDVCPEEVLFADAYPMSGTIDECFECCATGLRPLDLGVCKPANTWCWTEYPSLDACLKARGWL